MVMIKSFRWVAVAAFAAMAWAAQAADLGKIMFTGNSLAEGHQSDTISWQGGYRKVLEDMFTQDGDQFDFVGPSTLTSEGMIDKDHAAFGGKSIDDILTGIVVNDQPYGSLRDWITEYDPDTLVVELGRREYNDDINEIKAPIRRLMDVALGLKPSLKIIWNEQVIPDLNRYPGHDARHVLINQAINDVMKEYSDQGYDTWVSRVAASWDPATDLDLDGVHPSDAGFRKLAAGHYSTLRQAYGMPNPQPVPEPGLMAAGALGALAVLRRRRA